MRKKILFVSNEAARTGAPAILLGLIRWLQAHHQIEAISVLMRDGALREDFEQTCQTHAWIPVDLNQPERIHKRLSKAVFAGRQQSDPGIWLASIFENEKPDIIYLSTLVLGKYLQQIQRRSNQRFITHVHELLPSLRQLTSDHLVHTQLTLSDAVIACAPCVSQTLINQFSLSPSKCNLIPEYIIPNDSSPLPKRSLPPSEASSSEASSSEGAGLEKIYQAVDAGHHIFGIGGNPIHRKGFDLLPLLIQECKQIFESPFLAVWIGCNPGSEAHSAMDWDLTNMGLQENVALIPSVAMPTFRWILSQLDVLTLLSREDPFPLVVLEAGLLRIPTVCFEASGAIPEFAAAGECVSVNYLDVPAFAAAVHRLCRDPQEAARIGERCRQKVKKDLTLEIVAPQVAKVLFADEGTV